MVQFLHCREDQGIDELNESVDGSNFEYNFGNLKILKYGRKCRSHRRSKKYGFPLEIQQWRKRREFQESIVVAKIEYNLGNMKNCEDQPNRQKKDTPKKHLKPIVFDEKWMLKLQDKNQTLQEC